MIRLVVTSVGDPQLIGSGFCSLAVTGCSFRSVILFSKWWITDLECSPEKFAHCPMSRTTRWSLVFHAGDESRMRYDEWGSSHPLSNKKDGAFMNQVRLARLVGGFAALTIAVLLPAGAHAGPDHSAKSSFTLTITEDQQSRSVVLECDPTGGDHPRASAACEELQAVDGRFRYLDAGSSSSESCTKERRSVTASAQGFWEDRQVSYQSSTINLCELHRSTGSVFAF